MYALAIRVAISMEQRWGRNIPAFVKQTISDVSVRWRGHYAQREHDAAAPLGYA